MKTARLLGIALILAIGFSGVPESPRPAHAARCGAGVGWNIWNQIDSRQNLDTVGGVSTSSRTWSSRSVQTSDNGQSFTGTQTHTVNPDGSSSTQDDFTYTDSLGTGCESGGTPERGRVTSEDETDTKGNRKLHAENYREKNGKCYKWVHDMEWDSHGNKIKDEQSETEVPCGKYNLDVSWSGSFASPDGFANVTYGPNTATVFLESAGAGSYKGSYKGVFDASVSGMCQASGTVPVNFDVTAKEDELNELEISVTLTHSFTWNTTCPGVSGSATTPTFTFAKTFNLAPVDGESRDFTDGARVWTLTLRTVKPLGAP